MKEFLSIWNLFLRNSITKLIFSFLILVPIKSWKISFQFKDLKNMVKGKSLSWNELKFVHIILFKFKNSNLNSFMNLLELFNFLYSYVFYFFIYIYNMYFDHLNSGVRIHEYFIPLIESTFFHFFIFIIKYSISINFCRFGD